MESVTAWIIRGCCQSSLNQNGGAAMELSGKRVLIFAGPDFEDRELFYPLYRFLEAGATVKVAGLGEKTYKGKYGLPIEVDGICADFVKESWDAVVIPGGWAPDKIRANNEA